MEDTGLPIVKMNAKEKIDFHRPSHEKTEKVGEVTGLQREYWLDSEGKLNYKTEIGLDGQPLKHQLEGKLEKQAIKAEEQG